MSETIGLIAGNGDYPLILAANAVSEGYDVVAVALDEETDPGIEQAASRTVWISLTQLGTLIKVFREAGVTRAVMAGQVKKRRMYASDLFKLDLTAARLWAGLPDRKGETILRAVADELARHGIELQDATTFMGPYLAPEGPLTLRRLTPDEEADVAFGLGVAKVVAEHDIGQSVAVKDRSVVAVEAVEGTDACIRRAGELAGAGFVLVKVSRKGHDMRFDVPVVGERTVAAMREAGGAVLAVEAGKTLVLHRDAVVREAEAADIAITGIRG